MQPKPRCRLLSTALPWPAPGSCRLLCPGSRRSGSSGRDRGRLGHIRAQAPPGTPRQAEVQDLHLTFGVILSLAGFRSRWMMFSRGGFEPLGNLAADIQGFVHRDAALLEPVSKRRTFHNSRTK